MSIATAGLTRRIRAAGERLADAVGPFPPVVAQECHRSDCDGQMHIPQGYELPRGSARCSACGFHRRTQGHRAHCPMLDVEHLSWRPARRSDR